MHRTSCIFFSAALMLSCSCKTIGQQKSSASNSPMSSTPMSCVIDGQIISILKPFDTDTSSICSKYPCRATVLVNSVSSCGSSVTFSLKAGDTIEIKFVYTLLNTATVSPSVKARYPGLKKGAHFIANVEHHMKINSSGEFVISDYKPE